MHLLVPGRNSPRLAASPIVPTWYTLSATDSSGNPGGQPQRIVSVSVEAQTPSAISRSEARRAGFGIAAGSSLTSLSEPQLQSRFAGMRDLGVKWVRFDVDWSIIQADGPNSYNWADYDRVMSAAKQYQLNVLGIIDYSPGWARASACGGSAKCEPENVDTYAKFAGEVAARYANFGVNCWEIWNEPNNKAFWQPSPSTSNYSRLLIAAYAEIKRRNAGAFIITGGTSPAATAGGNIAPVDFLAGIYANNGGHSFDAVSHHPYTFPYPPSFAVPHAWNQMAATPTSLRSIMVAHGDGAKTIWLTEVGAPTGGPDTSATTTNYSSGFGGQQVDEALQALIVSEASRLFGTYRWAGPMFWYSYQDSGTDSSDKENFFGLLRYDGTRKPAYAVYQRAIAGN